MSLPIPLFSSVICFPLNVDYVDSLVSTVRYMNYLWICGFLDIFLKATFDMVLMWLHVDSISISTLKCQSSHIETKF